MISIIALLAAVFFRPYHLETIVSMETSQHTHVQVAGTVTLVRHEEDGDIHLRISDPAGRFIIAEIIPAMPLRAPRVGQRIVVFGIRRQDNENGHGWPEVHPVEKWIKAVR